MIDSQGMIRESDEITSARVYFTTVTFFPVVCLSILSSTPLKLQNVNWIVTKLVPLPVDSETSQQLLFFSYFSFSYYKKRLPVQFLLLFFSFVSVYLLSKLVLSQKNVANLFPRIYYLTWFITMQMKNNQVCFEIVPRVERNFNERKKNERFEIEFIHLVGLNTFFFSFLCVI